VDASDGDTITARCGTAGDYEQIKARFNVIDAPKKRQPFGQRSNEALSDLVYMKEAARLPEDGTLRPQRLQGDGGRTRAELVTMNTGQAKWLQLIAGRAPNSTLGLLLPRTARSLHRDPRQKKLLRQPRLQPLQRAWCRSSDPLRPTSAHQEPL